MNKELFYNGKKYFYPGLNNKNYSVLICNNSLNIKKLNDAFLKNINKKILLSIDFEFNRFSDETGREIALVQINIETNSSGEIYLFYPPQLSKEQIDNFKKLITSNNVKKIMHGAESLDMPYLFNNILLTSEERIKFCKNLYDTRYLCEFYNIEKKLDNKCKIYYLLKKMNVINEKQFEFILKNEEDMGPIWKIIVDINKMDDKLINYTVFDVLYLGELIKKFPNNDTYNKLIPELSSLSFILKNDNFFNSNAISSFNIYFLKSNKNIKLIDIYYLYYYWLNNKTLRIFLKINYFKKFFELIIKYYVYTFLIETEQVWINNDTFVKEKIKVKELNYLNHFSSLNNFLNNIEKLIKDDIYSYKK